MSDLGSGANAPPDSDMDKEARSSTDRGNSERTNLEQLERTESAAASVPLGRIQDEADKQAQVRSEGGWGEVPRNTSAAEIERLRAAMNAQIQLNQQREHLVRRLGGRDEQGSSGPVAPGRKSRVSPIHEETSPPLDEASTVPFPLGLETTSTESARTIRGGDTPGAMAVRTPSYPFPSMRTPGQFNYGHRPFTALSPTVNPANFAGGSFSRDPQDQLVSGSVTPASTLRFQPQGTYPPEHDPNFETPNTYELTLMLNSEPGLDAWWTTVVEIMRSLFLASRVTLSVPADTTDVENVPWGQKATFNVLEEDELSLTYLPRGSSMVPSSVGTNETSNSEDTNPAEDYPLMSSSQLLAAPRPGLLSRHSFTAFEDTKREPTSYSEVSRAAAARPSPLVRAKSYLSARPDLPPRTATLQNAQLNLQSLQDHMATEDLKPRDSWDNPQSVSREDKGRVFPVLQALDYEAEPLIDNKGVLRVLERGRLIALTRDYPYVENPSDEKSGSSKSSHQSSRSPVDKGKKNKSPDTSSRIASFLGSRARRSSRSSRSQMSDKGKNLPTSTRAADDESFPALRYEEYEQAPPSPWSQSPAPSPAVRDETQENPFFMNGPVDEETFNPRRTPPDYTDMPQLEAIGADKSWTVLHIPLFHPLLSKPVQSFRLDTAAMESKAAGRGKGVDRLPKDSVETKIKSTEEKSSRGTPIAILSVLSPVIPYPSNLRHSLNHLAPHLATSFSLCRHFSNLENEVAGLSRKRPQTAGFGAVAPGGGRSIEDRMNLGNTPYSPIDEHGRQQSAGGSITSPSDYSGMSRSTVGSPPGTPGWDPGSVGLSMDKRPSGESPKYTTGESYFSSKRRPGLDRVDTGSASSITGARRTSKESSPAETRGYRFARNVDENTVNQETPALELVDDIARVKSEQDDSQSANTTPKQEPHPIPHSRETAHDTSETGEPSPSRQHFETNLAHRRLAMRASSTQGPPKQDRQHTQLHSYGADFGATFQSLPTTSVAVVKGAAVPKSHSRSGSLSVPPDYMPPPSDRVKGIMLDSLPMHIFIALPPTGEIVWVNNRYLTYRGQSVTDLHEDPWASIHPEEREEYLKAWGHAVRTGEQFSIQVRLKRFDGTYRWFYTRAVGLRDSRGIIVQWYGTHMDIHDQHIAEVKAARQEEIEASEAKHRQLANLIPQIIFSATEEQGVTFANQQWLSYTGQDFDDSLGLGFMEYVHPEDLAKCQIPVDHPPTPRAKKPAEPTRNNSQASSGGKSSDKSGTASEAPTETTLKGIYQSLSRSNSSSCGSMYEFATADLTALARNGIIKVETDSEGRVSYSTEVRLRSKSGEYRWHLVRCVEVDNINLGTGDGSWFGACADINDHKLLEMKLKDAMDSKSKFLSNMSHEIRTPLIGISGMINFLQDSPLNDEQLDYCSTISSSADGLLNIINDILDLAKADAGMMKLSHEWFHTRSLVEEVNEMVSTLAITKHLEINYVIDADVPEMIKGDRFRIRQVLLNVIGNAIKFTTEGEVFSRCKLLKEESKALAENEVMLEFSIVDTGPGFSQEEAEVIFKPFSQIDSTSTRTHGGTGLGLVISRQLVELHGGKMEGTAVQGKGSTFTFSAVFELPTPDNHPEPLHTPAGLSARSSMRSSISNEAPSRIVPQQVGHPLMASKLVASPLADSPRTESTDSITLVSSGSSDPSIHSLRSYATQKTSASSIAQDLAHFSEAARAVGADTSQMKLALPDRMSPPPDSTFLQPEPKLRTESSSSVTTPTPTGLLSAQTTTLSRESSVSTSDLKLFRPPMYSILLICPQTHSREATTQHIEMTLPKDIPHQIKALASIEEAREMIGGDDPVIFTHIVLNLGSAEEIVSLIDQIVASASLPQTSIVVLSDPVQRQEVLKMATVHDYDQLSKDNRVTFIYKPVKPSRFAIIFDPDKERDLSTDRNRSTAQLQVATQRQNYIDISKRLGNKGHKVLLVEDNVTNQKVLLKFLSKIGIGVELALDGVECTDKVFSQDHSFYSLILVSGSLLLSSISSDSFHSATYTCPTKMGIRLAARFVNGKRRSHIRACLSSHYPQTSWPMFSINASKLDSATILPNPLISKLSAQ
jgi:PAS domain S-box-containing protein